MNANISMMRIGKKLNELYSGLIDMSDDSDPTGKHFETRALAALALMMKCGLDTVVSSSHITDGFHDMGIDAVYLDEAQKQLFLVQSKWRENGQGAISQEEMQIFIEGVHRIINLELDGANEKIQVKKNDIEFALTEFGYQIHAIYIHTGNNSLNEYGLRPLKRLLLSTNDEVDTLVVFDEIIYQDIYTFLATGQDSESIDLDDVILYNWGKNSAPFLEIYGSIATSAIGKWYQEYGNRLFAKNIRFYKGNTDVNDGIKKTLLEEPEKFFYYNNGIKLLCKKIHRKALESTDNKTGLFKLEGVSLVNGAQTTGCIGSAYAEAPEKVSAASVLIQIIDLSQADESVDKQITKLSNTQNRIENRDFASLDPTQERIRQELSLINYTYLYKSGDKVSDPESQFTFDEAIVALACLNEEISYVTLAKRNVGALSEDITKAPYKKLMNAGTNSYAVLNSVIVIRAVDRELQAKKLVLSGREKLVTIHGNRFIAYCVLQKIKKDENFFTSIILSDDLQERVISLVDVLIPPITDMINQFYSDSYPANIFKNAKKCKDLYSRII